ncbi:hypothetical protein [Mesorhizobium sp. M0965]|uniref:hypothetical protein n=1 Tax=unclassified Mesorhizobium TaxID=325217 RepID=UPI0033382A6C
MNGGKPAKESDEKRFNETLKRMLKTPPKPSKAVKRETKKKASPDDSKPLSKNH